jgi:hypothetical protein
MNDRVYVEVDPYVTKLLIPDYKDETLLELKRFYNTVSYGDFKNIILEHHPDKPIYSNHKFHSLFDISEGFLGNSLSVNDISVWYVERLFDEIKDFEKVFLLINFEQQFVVENQLNSIRSVLISKKSNWSKSKVLMWDLKKIINQIEIIKMLPYLIENKESVLVFANDNYIKYNNQLYDLTSSHEEVIRLLNKLTIYSKPSYTAALSVQQIKAIEYEFINDNFNDLDFVFQDYKFSIDETLISELLAFMEGKWKDLTDFIHQTLDEHYQLVWIGESKVVFNLLLKFIMPQTLIQENKIMNRDKFYFLHNMEEFNKSLKRVMDFKSFFKSMESSSDKDLDVTFESIHDILLASFSLHKDKKGISLTNLIEKHLQLTDYKIGNTVIR